MSKDSIRNTVGYNNLLTYEQGETNYVQTVGYIAEDPFYLGTGSTVSAGGSGRDAYRWREISLADGVAGFSITRISFATKAVIWSKEYRATSDVRLAMVGMSVKNGFLHVVQQVTFSATDRGVAVTKLDSSGNIVWSKKHSGDLNRWSNTVFHVNDNGYLLIGVPITRWGTTNNSDHRIATILFDPNGNTAVASIWATQETYGRIDAIFSDPVSHKFYIASNTPGQSGWHNIWVGEYSGTSLDADLQRLRYMKRTDAVADCYGGLVDGAGNIKIFGWTNDAIGNEYCSFNYNFSSQVISNQKLYSSGDFGIGPIETLILDSNNFFYTNSSKLSKFGSNNTIQELKRLIVAGNSPTSISSVDSTYAQIAGNGNWIDSTGNATAQGIAEMIVKKDMSEPNISSTYPRGTESAYRDNYYTLPTSTASSLLIGGGQGISSSSPPPTSTTTGYAYTVVTNTHTYAEKILYLAES
jgi:hypothetical protein